MSDSFFIPQRPDRKQKALCEVKRDPSEHKKAKRHYVNGVLVFDEAYEKDERKKEEEARYEKRMDVEFEYAENAESFEIKRANAMIASYWACHLYLDPVNVMYSTIYWLSQYVNYKLPESEWFSDHITNLMINPLRFELTSSQGIAYVHSNLSKHTLLMHIAGSPLHKIPSEYFVHKDAVEVLECLCHFLEPRNQCFLVRNTFGLRGELELAAFQYNRILSFFYEPSFLILTSYFVYVHYLLSIPHFRHDTPFASHMKHIRKPIEPHTVPWQRLFSLDVQNTNYDEKRQVFEEDLNALCNALAHPDIETVKNELTSLWSKKATYVSEQVSQRLAIIQSQLYPK